MTPEIVYRNIDDETGKAYLSIEKTGKHEYSYGLFSEPNEKSRHILDGRGSFDYSELVLILLSDINSPLEICLDDYNEEKGKEMEAAIKKGRKVWFLVKKMPALH
jgi:hypothetical protein